MTALHSAIQYPHQMDVVRYLLAESSMTILAGDKYIGINIRIQKTRMEQVFASCFPRSSSAELLIHTWTTSKSFALCTWRDRVVGTTA